MVYIIIYEQVYKILESHTNLIQKNRKRNSNVELN